MAGVRRCYDNSLVFPFFAGNHNSTWFVHRLPILFTHGTAYNAQHRFPTPNAFARTTSEKLDRRMVDRGFAVAKSHCGTNPLSFAAGAVVVASCAGIVLFSGDLR